MKKNIEIINIKLTRYISAGIISSEIKSIIRKNELINNNEITSQNNVTYFDIYSQFKCFQFNDQLTNIVVIGDKEKKREIHIKTNDEITLINVNISLIKRIPELIKSKQSPFLVWGFINYKDTLIILITFYKMLEG